ncbi:MAG: RcnB family protein [Gammaproteobacteria bacterium]|nr:RcnB family protein [Gammaproteobacteria bacterium]
MKLLPLAIGLFAALAFITSASAAPGPYAPGKSHEQRRAIKHHQHNHRAPPRHYQQQHRYPATPQSQWLWQQQQHKYQQPQHRPPHQQHRHHPPHRDQLRREAHRHSHHLSRAPVLPPHMHLVIGRPLPHGWSHRVPPGHARHLPQYAGYEWHSAGRDLILVAVSTGVVYTILDNILN